MKKIEDISLFLTRSVILFLSFACTLCILFTGCGVKAELIPKSLDNIKKLPKEYKDIYKNLLQNCNNGTERDQLRVEISTYKDENAVKSFLKKKSKLDALDTQTEEELRKFPSLQRKEILKEVQNLAYTSNRSPTIVEVQKVIDNKKKQIFQTVQDTQDTQDTKDECNDGWGARLTLYGEERELFKNIIIAFSEEDQKKLQELFNEPKIDSQNIANFCKVFFKFDDDTDREKIIEAFMYLYKADQKLALKVCNGKVGVMDRLKISRKADCYIPILQKLQRLLEDL